MRCSRLFTGFHGLFTGFHGLFTVRCGRCVRRSQLIHGPFTASSQRVHAVHTCNSLEYAQGHKRVMGGHS